MLAGKCEVGMKVKIFICNLIILFLAENTVLAKNSRELAKPKFSKSASKKIKCGHSSNAKTVAYNCDDKFIDPANGELGLWGKIMVNYLNELEEGQFFQFSNMIRRYINDCSLKNKQEITKKGVLLFNKLAIQESSCRPSLENNCSLRPGWGLFTLERKASDRIYRPRNCRGDITSVKAQIKCAVDIFIVTPNYWDPLNTRSVPRRVEATHVCRMLM